MCDDLLSEGRDEDLDALVGTACAVQDRLLEVVLAEGQTVGSESGRVSGGGPRRSDRKRAAGVKDRMQERARVVTLGDDA